MKERTRHFDSLAVAVTGRDISHILLLHTNRINGDHLDALLDWYQQEGWEFLTPTKALQDPIYSEKDVYRGHNGISWLLRLQVCR
jgi:hypothetical protein